MAIPTAAPEGLSHSAGKMVIETIMGSLTDVQRAKLVLCQFEFVEGKVLTDFSVEQAKVVLKLPCKYRGNKMMLPLRVDDETQDYNITIPNPIEQFIELMKLAGIEL